MVNYFPMAWRYPVGAMDGDDPEWTARLAGFFLVVQGALLLLDPLIDGLRFGTQVAFGVLGLPALMGGGSLPVTLILGLVLVTVGCGVLVGRVWADWAGVALALLLYLPRLDMPVAFGAGLFICYALGRRRRAGTKGARRPVDAPADTA